MAARTVREVSALLKGKAKVKIDWGCGSDKMPGHIGVDLRELPGVDVICDLEAPPFPFPDDCACQMVASHIVEHIKPWRFIALMDEWWRIMAPEGLIAIAHPYGVNDLFIQDPTHCNAINQGTWQYFDPRYPLWGIYKPKPWRIQPGYPMYQVSGTMEVLMTKLEDEKDARPGTGELSPARTDGKRRSQNKGVSR